MAYTQFVESLGYFVYEVTNAEVLSELRAACDEADGSGARGAVSLKEVGLRDGRSAVQAKLAALASFEEMLARTGTGFLVGSSVTYADLALFASLSELSEDDTCPTRCSRPSNGITCEPSTTPSRSGRMCTPTSPPRCGCRAPVRTRRRDGGRAASATSTSAAGTIRTEVEYTERGCDQRSAGPPF